MSQQQLYALLYVRVNGALLTEEASVDVQRNTNAQVVTTVAKGMAGVSPGAPNCTIKVKNAIPSAAFEYDAGPFMAALQAVEVGVMHPSGIQMIAKGFILSDSFGHSVNSESTYSFDFIGRMEMWE